MDVCNFLLCGDRQSVAVGEKVKLAGESAAGTAQGVIRRPGSNESPARRSNSLNVVALERGHPPCERNLSAALPIFLEKYSPAEDWH
jgi:hypothetical protein